MPTPIVADGGLFARYVAQYLIDAHGRESSTRYSLVEVGHVGIVVAIVMDLHGHFVEMGLKGIIRKSEWRQAERPGLFFTGQVQIIF